jgi:type IV secretory pathway VirB4 component
MEEIKQDPIIELIPRNADYKKYDYQKDFLGLDEMPANTVIFGGTGSGKTVVLMNLLMKKLRFEYKPENIYLFSKTAEDLDDSY